MRINHNIAALNTHRQMGQANQAQQESMEKLSSGLRINSAKDDAAGLAISEKMRGQIRGLDQATKNAQDANSLIQTAEGAMNESHSILQRMRELSVQSANDTNTSEDRTEIQKEVEQLKSEINRISTDTEFNKKTLMDGTFAKGAEITNSGDTGITSAEVFDSNLNNETYSVTTTSTSVDVDSSAVTDVSGIAINSGSSDVALGDYTMEVSNFDSGNDTADVIIKDDEGNEVGNEASLDISNWDSSAVSVGDFDITGSAAGEATDGTFSFSVEADATFEVKAEDGTSVATKTITDNTTGVTSVGGLELNFDGDLKNSATDTEVEVTGNSLSFHIGANENQTTNLSLNSMSSEALGVQDIDLTSREGAESAISTINQAIEDVSSERSKLGATQNRLDHTINNLGTSSENLTAAESRIRDVDYAFAA
ncbi:flagellin N-terminal helical domain-containing protein [Salimicrobium flavidum]|uniref:Flagellin n=1 Tax=Salimicrobium flavidum TaxID=570947 RepID=A0A1N7J177_9BACI|nr:flagellin [Salimicrobium flavidum]